mmetsp:Transcript_10196/g.25888  ORF Transcript_10196/g.25888 Transcript_10196/m.25888 type:complete len:218 (+) Transcript_10196:57-710(+)
MAANHPSVGQAPTQVGSASMVTAATTRANPLANDGGYAQGNAAGQPDRSAATTGPLSGTIHSTTASAIPIPSESSATTTHFTPEEQLAMTRLKEKLMRVSQAYDDLCGFLDQGGAETGLPPISDKDRCRQDGDSYSQEDAVRELKNEWMAKRFRDYIIFIQKSLNPDSGQQTTQLHPSTGASPGMQRSPQFARSPEQRASVATEFRSGTSRIKPFTL